MGFWKTVIIIVLIVGVFFYFQPDKKADFVNWLKGKSMSLFDSIPDGDTPDGEEGEIVGEGGYVLKVLYYGKPEKSFDCASDVDCSFISACADAQCLCDSLNGLCFKYIQ